MGFAHLYQNLSSQRVSQELESVAQKNARIKDELVSLRNGIHGLMEEISLENKTLRKHHDFQTTLASILCVLQLSNGNVALSGGAPYTILIYCARRKKRMK